MFIISLIALIHINFLTKDVSSFSAFMSDDQDETSNQHNPVDNEDMPHGTRTPPSRSPPPTSPLSSRVHAVAHLRPVCLETLDLPVLPDDRSQFDVHGALEDDKVKQLEYI